MSAELKKNRGGRREGSGRKSQGKKHVTLTLTEKTVDAAKGRTDNLSGLVDGLLSQWLTK
jgi:hypothetical protein